MTEETIFEDVEKTNIRYRGGIFQPLFKQTIYQPITHCFSLRFLMHNEQVKKGRPSLGSFFTNLRIDVPWPQKVRLLIRNNWIKIRNFQNCCGHPGEPGC